MKTLSTLMMAATLVCAFSSCSLLERWGVSQPSFKMIEKTQYTVGDKMFETRRYLVTKIPYETYVETRQIRR